MLTRYILQLVGSLGFMFYLNAALTGVLLAVVPFVSIMAVQYGKILVSNCCLMPTQQFFSYIMVRTS